MKQSCFKRRFINRRSNIMHDSTVQTDLHSPHSGGDIPPISKESTGSRGLEPTGMAPQVPLTSPRAQQRTFLPQRGLYYAAIAGVIAGVFTALLTIVVTLVFAGTFHAARQQIAVDALTVKTALALAGLELLNFTLSLL